MGSSWRSVDVFLQCLWRAQKTCGRRSLRPSFATSGARGVFVVAAVFLAWASPAGRLPEARRGSSRAGARRAPGGARARGALAAAAAGLLPCLGPCWLLASEATRQAARAR